MSNPPLPALDYAEDRYAGERSSTTPDLRPGIGGPEVAGIKDVDGATLVGDEARDALTAAEFGELQELLAEDGVRPEIVIKAEGLDDKIDPLGASAPPVAEHGYEIVGEGLPTNGVSAEDGRLMAAMSEVAETTILGVDTSISEVAIADGAAASSNSLGPSEFGIPPPPPQKSFDPLDHVDVDLGPLKSVSRNHAKIDYRPDLGHFCLDIHGRNGAWVDDRYYVKGSTVPLNQG